MKLLSKTLKDWPRKLTALFFGVLIWLSVNGQLQDHVILDDVPVILQYDPSLVVPDKDVFTVRVKVRGQGSRLRSLQTGDISIQATIGTVTQDIPIYSIPLSPENASSPFGTKVVEIIPNRLQVGIDRIVQRRNLPVRIRFEGELAEGYSVARTKTFPTTVSASGPSETVEGIQEVRTEPVVLDEMVMGDFETDVSLATIPKVTISPATVHVAVELTRHSIEKAIGKLPVQLMLAPDNPLRMATEPPTVSVTLRGPSVVVEGLERNAVRAFVDAGSVTNPGRYRFPVQVWVEAAKAVSAEAVFPASVEIELVAETPKPPQTEAATEQDDTPDEPDADRPRPPEDGGDAPAEDENNEDQPAPE